MSNQSTSTVDKRPLSIYITQSVDGLTDVFGVDSTGADFRLQGDLTPEDLNRLQKSIVVIQNPADGSLDFFILADDGSLQHRNFPSMAGWVSITPPAGSRFTANLSVSRVKTQPKQFFLFALNESGAACSGLYTPPEKQIAWKTHGVFSGPVAAIQANNGYGVLFAAGSQKLSCRWNRNPPDAAWSALNNVPLPPDNTSIAQLALTEEAGTPTDIPGRLRLFVQFSSGKTHASSPFHIGFIWGEPQIIGGANIRFTGNFAVTLNQFDLLEIFAVAEDRMYRSTLCEPHFTEPAWSEWSLFEYCCGLFDIGHTQNNELLLYKIATNDSGRIYSLKAAKGCEFPKQWTRDEQASVVHDVIVLGGNRDGRLECYVSGGQELLYKKVENSTGGWSGWSGCSSLARGSMVGAATLLPTLTQDGRIALFAVQKNGNIKHAWQTSPNNGWDGWIDFGSGFAGSPLAIACNRDGRLELAAIQNGKVMLRWQSGGSTGGWSGWTSLGSNGPTTGKSLAMACNNLGHLELFCVDGQGRLWHIKHQTPGNSWDSWKILGSGFAGPIKVLPRAQGLELFALTSEKNIVWMRQSYAAMNNGIGSITWKSVS